MIRYFWLCAVCVVVYFGSQLANLPTQGVWFFVEMATYSTAICAAAYFIGGSRAAIFVGGLESAAVVVNLFGAWQEITGPGLIWTHYDLIIQTIAIAEIFALIAGAPWNGFYRAVEQFRGNFNHSDPVGVHCRLAGKAV